MMYDVRSSQPDFFAHKLSKATRVELGAPDSDVFTHDGDGCVFGFPCNGKWQAK
jgi:hypothetical protein